MSTSESMLRVETGTEGFLVASAPLSTDGRLAPPGIEECQVFCNRRFLFRKSGSLSAAETFEFGQLTLKKGAHVALGDISQLTSEAGGKRLCHEIRPKAGFDDRRCVARGKPLS